MPFTRAGCSVGDFSTANMVLENTGQDIKTVFGANSPESQQLAADPDPFKDNEVADYIGVAVHCAKAAATCADAKAVKYGQTSPSPSASADQLPTEPGGYHGYQGLFGARYVAPVLGQGTPNKTHDGYPVTNSSGNLVDLERRRDRRCVHLSGATRLPGLQPHAGAVTRLHRRHAGERHSGDLRLHLRHARAQGDHDGKLHDRDRDQVR